MGAWAASIRPVTAASPRIVNGIAASEYPGVVAILEGDGAESAGLACSGVLVGCRSVLTAAHCVDDNPAPARYFVFLQHAGLFAVDAIRQHPAYDFPAADFALLELARPVTGVAPSAINTLAAPVSGSSGVIVGFGRGGGGSPNRDYGLKRSGRVRTTPCPGISGETDETSVCWDFKPPLGEAGGNSNTCTGDSGGPLFLDFGFGPVVAGTTSGGVSSTCLPTDSSYDANVYTYRDWLAAAIGDDRGPCSTLPQAGEAGGTVVGLHGTLDAGKPEALHVVRVGGGRAQLRVALNAVDDGEANFDLYLRSGAPPTAETFDCAAAGTGQYGYCEMAEPDAGPWYVRVRRIAGHGEYQLTVTSLAGEPTSTPTASSTPTPTPTPTASPPPSATPSATETLPTPPPTPVPAVVELRGVAGLAGGRACVSAFLAAGDPPVTRVDDDLRLAYEAGSIGECAINPAIGASTAADKRLYRQAQGENTVRISVLGSSRTPIPSGPLFTCSVLVAPGATPGDARLDSAPGASDVEGGILPVVGAGTTLRVTDCAGDCNGDGRVSIGELTRAVNRFLLAAPTCDPGASALDCPAADADRDGTISLADIGEAAGNLLSQCGRGPGRPAGPRVRRRAR